MGKRWTQEEDNILKTRYNKEPIDELVKILNRDSRSIRNRVYTLGITKANKTNYSKWTEEEDLFIRDNYKTMNSYQISLKLNKSLYAIKNRISILGLKQGTSTFRKSKTNIQILLNRSLISFYWLGFILADGCIYRDRLSIYLSINDIDHLKRFADYINCNRIKTIKRTTPFNVTEKEFCYVSVGDKAIIGEIKNTYGLGDRKTYNPPNLSKLDLSYDQYLSLLIGFIDGDGSINRINKNDYRIKILNHQSWLGELLFLNKMISDVYPVQSKSTPKIIKSGMSQMIIYNNVYKHLYEFSLKNNLPILYRKWCKSKL